MYATRQPDLCIGPECPSPTPQSSRSPCQYFLQSYHKQQGLKQHRDEVILSPSKDFFPGWKQALLWYRHCPLLPVTFCGHKIRVSLGEFGDRSSTGGIHIVGILRARIHTSNSNEMEK